MCRMTPLLGDVISLVIVGNVLVYVNYRRQIEKSMNVAYTKMHGTGNRILVVDQRDANASPPSAQKIRELGIEVVKRPR